MSAEVEITIRRAQPADAPLLVDLICALADYEKLPRPDQSAQQRLIEHGFGPAPKFTTFLAFAGEKAVGYTINFETYSTFLARPTLYLEDLFVLPDYRNQRVGSALFENLKKEARQRECGRIEWVVLDWNENAIRFYQKLGAKRLNEWFSYRLTEF